MLRLSPLLLIGLVVLACGDKPTPGPIVVENNDPNLGGPASGLDGSACSSDSRCDGEVCLSVGSGWTGGYCTTVNCRENECHGDHASCVSFLDGSSLCLSECASSRDCRAGYRCRPIDASGGSVCWRDDEDGPPPGQLGASCSTSADCDGDLACDTALPGGYCIDPGCGGACIEDACVMYEGGLRCMDACESTRDCRTGYVCDRVEEKQICVPAVPATPTVTFEETAQVLGVQCGGERVDEGDDGIRWRLPFDIASGVTSYVVTPFVKTGSIRPLSLEHPTGTLDLVDDYRHHNLRITEFQFFDQESTGTYGEVAFDWPILIPFAPRHQDLVSAGAHVLEVLTSVDEPCLYVTTSGGEGTRLDLNVYFVGVPDYGAQSAPGNPDINQVFGRVNEILGAAGVSLGEIAFYDAPREVAERYSIVRSLAEIKRATAFGQPRDASLRGHLNIDVFLMQDIAVDGATVLGLSAGLPGAPGLHGNAANGLVFTSADLGVDNDFVAHVMAHELGHYLGLRHTTEVVHGTESDQEAQLEALLGTTDPIADTPECERLVFNPASCPDVNNLMFPSAPQTTIMPVVTPGQGSVLRANPFLYLPEESP